MSTNDYGTTVSRTLQAEFRAFDTLVFNAGKPALDSEINLLYDIAADKLQKYIQSQIQSGFYNNELFAFDASWSNKFQLPISTAFVNGLKINVNAYGDQFIYLNPASLGNGNHRYDFVFLEVWKTIISGETTEHKPSSTTIYKEGNVQNTIETLPDDIYDPVLLTIDLETSKRVQVQYRIRIQEDTTTPNQQNSSIFDGITFAQGGALIPIDSFTFINLGASIGDYGLWRAGNGDNASRSQLQTVDGYVYAIPIALVFRRSIAPYIDEDLGGQFASDFDIASASSDRPDGLFYDSVCEDDVIDVRHKIAIQQSYDDILRLTVQDLLTGQNKTKRPISLRYDALSDVAITGYSILGNADKTKTTISDVQTTVVSNVVRINVGDTDTSQDFYTSRASGSWQIGDTITIKVPNGSPLGTLILGTNDANVATKPFVYKNAVGLTNVLGSWTGTGTPIASFAINENLAGQELWIVYDIQYPVNQGLSFIADDILKVNYVNAASFPISQTAYVPHSGIVRASSDLSNTSLYVSRHSKQLNYTHTGAVNSFASNYQINKHNKEIKITPIVSSTTVVSGITRTLYTTNTNATTRKLYLPFATNKVWMIKGVYTSQSGISPTDDVVTISFYDQQPSIISGQVFRHPTSVTQYSFAKITAVVFVPTSTDLIAAGYSPVYRQSSNGNIDQFVLVNSSGVIYNPPSSNPVDYKLTYKSIPTVNVAAYTTSSSSPVDNWIQVRDDAIIIDGQQLWIDMDYIAELHDGAQTKIIYKYLPYQGVVDSTGLQLSAVLKSITGLVHTDGTGNVGINIDVKKYPRTLISYLPTQKDIEYLLKGDAINGVGNIGKFSSTDLCYALTNLLDYSDLQQTAIKLSDIVTARYNDMLSQIERGGNEATALKSVMILPLNIANYKQAVVFALGVTADGFALKNELVLYVWTYTNNDASNILTSADADHIGVDFFFINQRLLTKKEGNYA
jgi:hypothetical protein